MKNKPKVGKLIAPTVPLTLAIDEHLHLDLKLAWTMKGVILIETKLREFGIQLNVLQNPKKFWDEINATMLAVAVWACAQQEHWSEYGDEEGFDIISSYIILDTYAAAAKALHDAFYESLSDERKAIVKKAEEEAVARAKAGEPPAEGQEPAPDPTQAPTE